ncbi:hypothetical protein HBH92_107130 [Parastagonospora nodorum]|nr:hypothetical protein HBH92_107130 [Parastagonospora nodorum]KAH4439084.1 hypothetical protein HBH93_095710 [Parastagonospora nodorum]KAH4444753.1 hypothetical protein HBH91_153350 [Parastagonospora nodorum]KAH4491787.1 hypothetical protein HBH89_173330 [Parastagonospora nodorum]KAH4546101.1 hypothetical protein HBH85_075320 [Parastagonospora nodorum]
MGPEKTKSEHEATVFIDQTGPKMEPYTYQSLAQDRDEIRLLKLLPGNPIYLESKHLFEELGQYPILLCQLITVEFGKAPPYVALSYTWANEGGDADLTRYIIIRSEEETRNGGLLHTTDINEVVHITMNCEAALRQTRNASNTEFVWIDAICIDQNRISERNYQVSIMDRIYTRAESVEVCIQSHAGFHLVLDLLEGEDSGILTSMSHNGHGSLDIDSLPELIQLDEFLKLRYFSRVWVLQEVALARHAILRVNDRGIAFPEKAFKQLARLYATQPRPKHRLSQWASLLERDASIISCLHASMNSSASDPRDKVFAITGLLTPHIRAMISIDYMSTIDEVFTQAVLACIVDCQDLEILCYASLPASADHTKTPIFTVHDFRQFLAHRVGEIRVDRDPHFIVERSEGLIPTSQILPRLTVRAHFLDACLESISDGTVDHITG